MEIKKILNKVRTKSGSILYTAELKDGKIVLLSSLESFKDGDKVLSSTPSDPQIREGVPVPMFIMCSLTANYDTLAYQIAKDKQKENNLMVSILGAVVEVDKAPVTEAQKDRALDVFAKIMRPV